MVVVLEVGTDGFKKIMNNEEYLIHCRLTMVCRMKLNVNECIMEA